MKKEDNTQYVTFHMKPPKYMVGDLVYIDNKTRKITAINDSGQYHIKVEDGTAIVKSKEVVPIPLTSEILEKNGWVDDGIDYDYQYKDKLYLIVKYSNKKHGIIENAEVYNNISLDSYDVNQNDFYLRTVSAVHELQHLLYGLGFNSSMKI